MYVLLSQLSVSDVLLSTSITPNFLWLLLNGGGTISATGCITQFYLCCVSATSEFYLLTVMSYDRYHFIIQTLSLSESLFLGHSSYIEFDDYFCNLTPLLKLSCTDYKVVTLTDIILLIPFMLFPFCLIIFTYISIGLAILRISSTEGRHKAFSTCSSHLIVVCMYYGTMAIVYIIPSKQHNFDINKMLSLLYTVGTPF
ncbi:hypothetical protein XELAEV_18019467mg [Xenopus laevis]|uniref:G-protein coupled receptors family 1 profile domain-containing protein n=1 Tax=Xenopus laevis TaxID=8355 RepID=A0A974DG69_XENLA|nr:hypothetical protein XELAEV_18019467mg [Xenopus laevis]